jgi:hypothetical protein
MKIPHQLIFIVLGFVLVTPFAKGIEPDWPVALEKAQIKALTTGDLTDLKPFSDAEEPIRIAASWTTLAATQFKAAKVTVSRESAWMTSEFISRGAQTFVAEGSTEEKRSTAERNLQRFIAAEIEIGTTENPENPKIGEGTFVKARRSLCPLWPFCRK